MLTVIAQAGYLSLVQLPPAASVCLLSPDVIGPRWPQGGCNAEMVTKFSGMKTSYYSVLNRGTRSTSPSCWSNRRNIIPRTHQEMR